MLVTEELSSGGRIARWAFWPSLLTILALTLAPLAKEVEPPSLLSYDKFQHFTAFAGLASLAGLGWGLRNAFRVGLGISAVAASIEILQALPIVHRDPSFWDWTADIVGIACGFSLLVYLPRMGRRLALLRPSPRT
jgi:hypothetical protein